MRLQVISWTNSTISAAVNPGLIDTTTLLTHTDHQLTPSSLTKTAYVGLGVKEVGHNDRHARLSGL